MRWMPLLALLLVGCPRDVPPVTSGDVADERPAFLGLDRPDIVRQRRTIERKLAVLSTLEGPAAAASQRRLEGALLLLQDLEGRAESLPRDQERAAIKAFANYLDAMLHAEPAPAAESGPQEEGGPLARAVDLARRGAYAEAVELGSAARDELYVASVDSVSLLRMLAEWALEADRPDLAVELLTDARRLAARVVEEQEGLRGLMDEANEALLGPAAAAAHRAREFQAVGELAAAAEAYETALELAGPEDDAVRALANRELEALLAGAAAKAVDLMARVDVLLAGEGPYDHAAQLLVDVEALPESAVDDAELLRLRAWHRSLTSTQGAAQAEANRAELDARLALARDRVAAGSYREAVAAFRELEGTPLQAQARQEARSAIDELVRQERERAGRLFVAARKQQGAARSTALGEVRSLLQGLLDEFPDSGYAGRVAENLAAVDRELGK